ncbi:ABC transporter ATP-binding protein [bacterium]|nr:ABC transporter ATP-binding protein [bacterium]
MVDKAIILENVSRSFGKKKILQGVSGEVETGKIVGILGRNGEGKTTLFRILLDLLAADEGNISVLGMQPDGSGKIRKSVGYVPERPAYHEFMKVEDVLKWRASFYPNWNWDTANNMVKRLNIHKSTPIKGASKGTLAKLAWILACSHHPPVLFLDEPTSGLDTVVREMLLSEFVQQMAAEGKTILITNHHMDEMLGVLDEVWILSEGKFRERLSMDELRQTAHVVSGRLNGSIPEDLNVFEKEQIGNLVRWVVMDKITLEKIRQSQILDGLEIQPLPLDSALRTLLARTADPA